MKSAIRALTATAGILLAGGLLAAPGPAGAVTSGIQASAVVAGTGHATARSVTIADLAHPRMVKSHTVARAPLGRNGKPAGSTLPVKASTGSRTVPVSVAARAGGPNGGAAAKAGPAGAVMASSGINPGDFQGGSEGGTDCSGCATPDVTAAVGTADIAETTNAALDVFSKSTGSLLCSESLATILGATTALSHPRIEYDNTSSRFSFVVDSVPGTSGDVPIQYLAATQTSNPCGAWWVYSIIFNGEPFYPLGAVLDFPFLGQDNTSILSSTNNFSFTGSYIGSAAYAMPKADVYTGAPFSFNTYSVAFSTAPVTVAGIPTFSTTTTYWLAAVPGTGYDLYSMPTNPAGAITLAATISAPFTAPTRQVNQPGTPVTLNPLDGRIQSAAVQDGNFIWFAHDVNDAGFPTVQYGAIDVANDQIQTSLAFHSSASDDFNPSIGVADAGGNTNFIWVNWAYTNAGNGVPVSDTIAGVGPGQGIPELAAADLTLARGTSVTTSSSFGSYSSVQIDPSAEGSCPAGETAVSAQEFFNSSSTWSSDIAQTTFC